MLVAIYGLTVTLMILLPLALAFLLRRRYVAPLWLFCVGMATFIGSQLVHFPLNDLLVDVGLLQETGGMEGGQLLQTALILGFTAGLGETTARAVGYWFLFRRDAAKRWEDGVMVGLGHGGIEAMIFGGVLTAASVGSLWALRDADLSALNVSPEQLQALTQQMALFFDRPWHGFLGLLERSTAILLHVSLSLLVWRAFQRRNVGYAVLALAYHWAADAGAVYMIGRVGPENLWLVEAVFVAIAAPGLLWIWWLWRQREPAPRPVVRPLAAELELFVTATRKELLQQWRTKRLLVVAAVFLLFGFLSPLIANFTPELLRTIEGAEQFADLVPTPTAADSLGQYIKNITQFGFIIAILLGMGAVAGEKERGTTAMILSKPLPRWAFILSKFVAQALVYALGFALAAVGAYYYTMILFEPFALGPFLLGNLLLLIWLLVFAAVTLLGSALASTTGAAAAIALGGAMLLLVGGSLPTVGAFAPSALVGWAGQSGVGEAAQGNWGALAANAVLIIVMLVSAVAAFETQEL
ncbi:MAG: YhfC family glutamic-type intramembrane protease [Chloroflexota bacterium]